MSKRKLNYRFHNPNPADAAATYIAALFVEVNKTKVDQALAQSANQHLDSTEMSNQEHLA